MNAPNPQLCQAKMSVRPAPRRHCATKMTLLYRVIVTVRQQFADSFPHYITQERNGKSSKYKTLEHLKAYGDRHSAPTLSVKCCRISTLTLYTKLMGTCSTEAQKVCTIRRPLP